MQRKQNRAVVVAESLPSGQRPCKKALATPNLWIGRTKEFRTQRDLDDPVRYERFVAVKWIGIQIACIKET